MSDTLQILMDLDSGLVAWERLLRLAKRHGIKSLIAACSDEIQTIKEREARITTNAFSMPAMLDQWDWTGEANNTTHLVRILEHVDTRPTSRGPRYAAYCGAAVGAVPWRTCDRPCLACVEALEGTGFGIVDDDMPSPWDSRARNQLRCLKKVLARYDLTTKLNKEKTR